MNSKTNQSVTDTSFYDERQHKIATNIGMWQGGERVTIRGYSLFDDLFDKVSYMQVLVLNITGRLISDELSIWLNNNFQVMSYPDARIWCNQVGAICGTTNTSPAAATAAGALAADSRIYGGSKTSQLAMEFIHKALEMSKQGMTVDQIIDAQPVRQGKPAVIGYARPVAKDDERIGPHREMTKRLGFGIGEHMALANEISDSMEQRYGIGINIGGYTSAFMADQGFSPKELYQIKCLCVASGVTACYVDNLQHPENSFLPLQCDEVEYKGPAIRSL